MLKPLEHSVERLFALFNLKISRMNSQVPEVLFEVDQEFNSLYTLAQQRTQMAGTDNSLRRQRHYILVKLLKQSAPLINEGDAAECGCWRGLSSFQIATHLKSFQFQKKFYIFDSFEGLSRFTDEDRGSAMVRNEDAARKHFECPLDCVRDNLREFGFIELKKGWIPERFGEISSERFSFVHIDVDLYQPIRDSLEFFYPRMIPGGIIVLDDYGYLGFPGAKKATDEFIKNRPDFFLDLPSGSAFIIKK